MKRKASLVSLCCLSVGLLSILAQLESVASAQDTDEDSPALSLFDGLRSRQLEAHAKGDGRGGMVLSVTNRTKRPVNVVLPPGLVVTSATGQFGGMGGMGGMGGGMGRMGGMGGGMMGGMGGMGGGMGGMGGGMMGGRGGMMGGGMNRMMPPMMGMMTMAGQIVRLTGEFDSWDYMSQMLSFRAGFMGGMMGGRGMMGGMGGGMMGGMGGGMMGGMGGMMGGGMRSIPAVGLPQATLGPERTAQLPTNLVSLRGPDPSGRVNFPAKNEKLRISEIGQTTGDAWTQTALRELSAHEAPQTVAQLVMWHVAIGFEWDTIARLSRSWANPCELELAKSFVNDLRRDRGSSEKPSAGECKLYFELTSRRSPGDSMEKGIHALLDGGNVLGLKATSGIPVGPSSPSVAVRIRLDEQYAQVQLAVSSDSCDGWKPVGKFHVELVTHDGRHIKPMEVTDDLTEQILGHLIDTQIVRRRSSHGSSPYLIRVGNATPLVLNSLAIGGLSSDPLAVPALMVGMGLPPHQAVTVPADEDTVRRLRLHKGMKPVAANLGGL